MAITCYIMTITFSLTHSLCRTYVSYNPNDYGVHICNYSDQRKQLLRMISLYLKLFFTPIVKNGLELQYLC